MLNYSGSITTGRTEITATALKIIFRSTIWHKNIIINNNNKLIKQKI